MRHHETAVVIGAGPYGLSAASQLRARGIPTHVFGKTMEFWRGMPSGINLKSVWTASTLYGPKGRFSLDHYCAAQNIEKQEPIPLPLFMDYCAWFQQQTVPEIDETYVSQVARDGRHFRVELADGRALKTTMVVVATGISDFTYIPSYAQGFSKTLVSHTQDHAELSKFKGRRVVMVGSGQSALEYAALLHEAGAEVEVIARGPIIWINRVLYDKTGPARHVFYPASDVGPPGLNWLISYPLIYRRIPEQTRLKVDKRAIRPAGAQWLRPRVEGLMRLTEFTQIEKVQESGDHLCLSLSDGSTREIDHLMLGTGYKPSIDKYRFLDTEMRGQIRTRDGYPVLNSWFESSVPQLHFAGAIAGYTFGPICRFVAGSKVPAAQVAQHAIHRID